MIRKMEGFAVVTGSSRGLGAYMIRQLASEGYDVVINHVSDSSKEKAAALAAEVTEKHGVKAVVVQGDVSSYENCEKLVVAGEEDRDTYLGDPLQLVPYMESSDMTMQLLAAKMDILLMPYATAFETPADPTASLTAATVLKTGPNAYVRRVSDGHESMEKQPGDASGELSVGVFAHRMFASGNVSRMFAAGGSPAFIWEYIYESAYTEEFLTAVLGELLPQSRISLDIMASTALRPALGLNSKPLGIALTVAVPVLILLAALFILLPRRSR